MDTFFENLENVLNSGDEEVRTWFLIRHKYLPFILVGCYVLFSSSIGPALMRNRKPFQLRAVLVFFNLFLVATYATVIAIGLWCRPEISWDEFCIGAKVKKGHVTYTYASIFWVVYMLKYLEFLDTVFFILRKKDSQVTFLHIVHHAVVPIIGWLGFRTEKSGMQIVPGAINSFVHVIMYSYYGLSAMGPRVRKHLWWKKYLTQLQMIQFFLIILFVTVVAPLSGCTMIITGYITDIVFAPLFLYLFYKFYKMKFKPNQKSIQINEQNQNGFSQEKTKQK